MTRYPSLIPAGLLALLLGACAGPNAAGLASGPAATAASGPAPPAAGGPSATAASQANSVDASDRELETSTALPGGMVSGNPVTPDTGVVGVTHAVP